MTTEAPTRCCVRTLRGERCQNDASPSHGWIMVGPVRLAACGLSGHQTALRKLPNFVRHNVYCGAVGCDRPSAAGICPKHRDMYRDFGITEHMLLATEPAPMVLTPLPVPAVQPPPPDPEAPHAVAPPPRGILDRATGPGTDGASDGEEVEPDPLPPVWQPLDPGIATAVELLRAEGLATTDSGDGYSKVDAIRAKEANNHGHVFIDVCGGMSADDIIAAAQAIPWTDYGYRVPTVELLSREGQCIHAGSDPDVVAVLWKPGEIGPDPLAAAPHPLEARRDALVERLKAAGFGEGRRPVENLRRFHHDPKVVVLIPDGHPCEVEGDFAMLLDKADEQCAKVEAAKQARQGDVVDHAAPQSDVTVVCVVDYPTPEALLSAIFGPPKVEPTAPGPTMAELQEQIRLLTWSNNELQALAAAAAETVRAADLRCTAAGQEAKKERKRANELTAQLHDAQAQLKAITAALDADPERSPAWDDNDEPIPLPRRVEIALMPEGIGHSRGERRAHELEVKLGNLEAMDYPGQLQTAIAEIETACVMLRRLGGTSRSVPDLLMQVLSPEDRRAILEVEAAEWRAAIARLKARRVNPPTPERLADYAGKLAKVEAQIAALPDSQTPAAAAWSLEAGLWLLKIAGIWLAECKPGDYLLISGAGRFPAESNDPQDVLRRRGLPLLPAEALDHSPDAGNMVS